MILEFHLNGQVCSGKNNMRVGRNGRHYPTKRWAAWRDIQLMAIKLSVHRLGKFEQGHQRLPPITTPCSAKVVFTHADKRRRDVPGMLDALCHVLERAGVVKDDSLIVDWDIHTVPESNKAKAGVEIRVETL